jgi:hypothetical protein
MALAKWPVRADSLIPSAQTTFTFLPAREGAKMVRAEGITSAGDSPELRKPLPITNFLLVLDGTSLFSAPKSWQTRIDRWTLTSSCDTLTPCIQCYISSKGQRSLTLQPVRGAVYEPHLHDESRCREAIND